MRKIIRGFVVAFFVICIAILILNHNKDYIPFYDETVGVQVVYMIQNPDSGEYEPSIQEQFTVLKGSSYSHNPIQREYYDVDLERSYISSAAITEPTEFVVYYDCELCTVTFNGNGGELVEGEQTLTLRKGQLFTDLPVYKKVGYVQTGFDKSEQRVYSDEVYTATWELEIFNVYLYLIDGSSLDAEGYVLSEKGANCYVKGFDFTQGFTLPEQIELSTGYSFNGWNTQSNGGGEAYTQIEIGTAQDLHLYAQYDVEIYSFDFILHGNVYYSLPGTYGSPVHAPTIPASEQISGYGLNWYADESFNDLYEFTTMPEGGATVYGMWEKDTGIGFLDWDVVGEEIDSKNEIYKFVDYVRFYNVTEENYKIKVNYTTDATQVSEDLLAANSDSSFRCGYRTVYGTIFDPDTGDLYAICFCESENNYEKSLITLQANDYTVYNYLGYAEEGRGDYNDFYIEKLANSKEVEYTNQLLYVVEHGYKPICKPNSPAERIYNKAKAVLNGIIKANYTDYQKVEAIYNWLVMNVQYDHAALSAEVEANWWKYDSFYMEGVFNNKKAVCDGIAKSFSLMCNIEGIPCVEVTGNKHAWCRVKVNNAWFVVDPTQGNIQIEGSTKSIMTHSQFLITDSKMLSEGYSSADYRLIDANGKHNYYENKKFEFNGEFYDYKIDSVQEFAALLVYANSIEDNLSQTSIDVQFSISGHDISSAYALAKSEAESISGKAFRYSIEVISDDSGAFVQLVFCS